MRTSRRQEGRHRCRPRVISNAAINYKGSTNKSMRRDRDNSNIAGSPSQPRDMVMHLIDSPGHVDFSAEVTSSLLLCGSAIFVVDAVKGLCAPTHSLVREAYLHRLVPILVINKVDRLCGEMGLDPTKACVRICGIIEPQGMPMLTIGISTR
jgi:translation elongation factor EF-G